jgi:hypothetical protein
MEDPGYLKAAASGCNQGKVDDAGCPIPSDFQFAGERITPTLTMCACNILLLLPYKRDVV